MKLIASDGKEYTLDKAETYIGRRSSNDIVLAETRVSGEHAVIRREGDAYVLTDLGSTNGTKVNGQLISAPHTLREGDSIEIGGFTLRFSGVAEDLVRTQADFDEFDAPRMAAPAAPPAPAAPAASEFDAGFKAAPSGSEFDSGFKSTPSSGATPPPASFGSPPPYAAPPAQKKGPNWLLIGGIGCLALICLGVIIGAVIFLVPALGGGVAPGGLFGNQATLTVINQSSDAICFLYISPTTSDTWGDDYLGSSVLDAGSQQSFSVGAGSYDLRAEMCGGEVVERYDVSLSGTVEWSITD